MSWKPESYNSVSPYIIANGAGAVLDFLGKVFDAEVVGRMDRPDGTIMHAEARIDDSIVMITDATPEWPALVAMVHVYVPDVDEVFRRALEAGAVSLQEPSQGDDPDRRCGFEDPAGNSWWAGTRTRP